jgi:cytochrome c oxidase subunit IV
MAKKNTYLFVAIWLVVFTLLELMMFSHLEWGAWRTWGLLTIMSSKALMVALVYMNLRQEGWALKTAFFAPIPVAIYFLLFMVYDAAYIWKS